MYIQKEVKSIHTNFQIREFLRTQKLGKHPLSTESGAATLGARGRLSPTTLIRECASFYRRKIQGVQAAVKISVSTARIESRATDISLGRSKNIFFPETGSIK